MASTEPVFAMVPERAGGVTVSRVESCVVMALRYLPDGKDNVVQALRAVGLVAVPAPGQWVGPAADVASSLGPWALWRSPTEVTLLSDQGCAAVVQTALAGQRFACAIDLSDGVLILELRGAGASNLDDLLAHLMDIRSIPATAGAASRARLVDIPVVSMRLGSDRLWLMADACQDDYLSAWLQHAGAVC
ncbi:MAG: hypothetical protein ACKODU_09055 [Limnohabitans sp.]